MCALTSCKPIAEKQLEDIRLLMGTSVSVRAEGLTRAALKAASDASFREMTRLSDMMNHRDPESVVSAINREAGRRVVAVPPEVMEVLSAAQRVSQLTDGAFDITVGALSGWRFDPQQPRRPSAAQIRADLASVDYRGLILDRNAGTAFLRRRGMRIDLGGIAKLYILDAGIAALQRAGVPRAMINGGGDIIAYGGTSQAPWRIGIRDPRSQGVLMVIERRDAYVVSSGDYERYFELNGQRYHHILNPRTGLPSTGLRQVSLVAERLADVNGLSAALMVMGPQAARRFIESRPSLDGILIDTQHDVWISPRLARERVLLDGHTTE